VEPLYNVTLEHRSYGFCRDIGCSHRLLSLSLSFSSVLAVNCPVILPSSFVERFNFTKIHSWRLNHHFIDIFFYRIPNSSIVYLKQKNNRSIGQALSLLTYSVLLPLVNNCCIYIKQLVFYLILVYEGDFFSNRWEVSAIQGTFMTGSLWGWLLNFRNGHGLY